MKVVFCIRPDWETNRGGDAVQLLETRRSLESQFDILGQICTSPDDPALAEADIVHVFNVQTAELSLEFARRARAAGKPIALSTIYWDLSHARFVEAMFGARLNPASRWAKALKPGFDATAGLAARLLGRPRYVAPGRIRQVRELVETADVLLPNSEEEGQLLLRHVGLRERRIQVVVNGTNLDRFQAPASSASREGVLMAARIEPIKNQMAVVQALRSEPSIPATFVGAAPYPRYLEAVQKLREGKPGQVVPNPVPQDELARLYQRAEVHVLPSFRESPGLSTLEALATGAKAVVSTAAFCPVHTYFDQLIGKTVFLCDPYSPSSVRQAIDQALSAPRPQLEQIEIIRKFDWALAARQTHDAYRAIWPA
jgi:glycosyltransferase involved in cell wall biosynthesis